MLSMSQQHSSLGRLGNHVRAEWIIRSLQEADRTLGSLTANRNIPTVSQFGRINRVRVKAHEGVFMAGLRNNEPRDCRAFCFSRTVRLWPTAAGRWIWLVETAAKNSHPAWQHYQIISIDEKHERRYSICVVMKWSTQDNDCSGCFFIACGTF